MKPIHLIFTFIVLTMFSCTKEETTSIDLSGEWNFQMDPENIGQSNKWFENQLEETIQLPGSMVENDKGYEITLETDWTGGVKNEQWHKDPNYAPYHDDNNIRFPFWLQPNKKYTGAAWYQREVELSKKWLNKAVWLNLERPHWETNVWIIYV